MNNHSDWSAYITKAKGSTQVIKMNAFETFNKICDGAAESLTDQLKEALSLNWTPQKFTRLPAGSPPPEKLPLAPPPLAPPEQPAPASQSAKESIV